MQEHKYVSTSARLLGLDRASLLRTFKCLQMQNCLLGRRLMSGHATNYQKTQCLLMPRKEIIYALYKARRVMRTEIHPILPASLYKFTDSHISLQGYRKGASLYWSLGHS